MVRLIHRSVSIHELLLHRVCERAGLYADAGLDVVVEDGAGANWRSLSARPDAATVAVGGVVAEWLRGDRAWQIHFIATVRPLIWVVGARRPIRHVDDLVGCRIATPPMSDMPSVFLCLVVERHGRAVGRDVQFVEAQRRSDRRRLLGRGEADAALLGPEGLALQGGPADALYLGEYVEYPTVGVAARPGLDPDVSAALAAAHRDALRMIKSDPALAADAMLDIDPDVTGPVADYVSRAIMPNDWTADEWARAGGLGDVVSVAESIGAPLGSTDEAHQFLHGWTDERSTAR
jgi:ABC-type nitrate/sulfonate/bicarbonate transport system substrate-binding protein